MSVSKDTYSMGFEFTFLTAQLRRVHGLTQYLDCHTASFLQVALLLVVLLEQTLRTRIVCTNTGCLPSTVVSAWIALIQLKLSLRIPSGIDERDTERPKPSVLRVALL